MVTVAVAREDGGTNSIYQRREISRGQAKIRWRKAYWLFEPYIQRT